MEPLVKVMSGDLLPHSGAILSCNFGKWNHHSPHSNSKSSFQLKIALEVGLQLIHPDFCKWLYATTNQDVLGRYPCRAANSS